MIRWKEVIYMLADRSAKVRQEAVESLLSLKSSLIKLGPEFYKFIKSTSKEGLTSMKLLLKKVQAKGVPLTPILKKLGILLPKSIRESLGWTKNTKEKQQTSNQ